ncbi:unnamed protein product [Microthlaspi erraticum]|uniref:Reverse transcriptase RNase H-like domain-containing protein n=1 Tax=Microthlaspi erraticum TaxID=1685480 RepID=A0A6D2LC51_9BRAS|nr:unnamed protein product [Microthlaspi erraticum]
MEVMEIAGKYPLRAPITLALEMDFKGLDGLVWAMILWPPRTSYPIETSRRRTAYLYLAASPATVSGMLIREERDEQKSVYYVTKTLIDAETRYPPMEKLALALVMSASKLRPYFQSHSIVVMTSQPLRTVLHSPNTSGRLVKWAIELSEYDIEY